MTKTKLTTAVGATLLAASQAAHSSPFQPFDPRSMAMGGTGVAVGSAATAPLYNPALLATSRDRFAMELPIMGVRAYDPDEFADSVDDFQDGDYIDRLDAAIDRFNDGNDDTIEIRSALNDLDEQLIGLGGRPIQAELGVGTVVAVPGRDVGVAFSAVANAAVGGIINYEDSSTFANFQDDLSKLDECNALAPAQRPGCVDGHVFNYIDTSNPSNPRIDFDAEGDDSDIQSSVDVRALSTQEFGISLARELNLHGHNFAVGITPKYVRATVLDYTANVDTADDDDIDADDYRKDYSHFNIDIGVAKYYNNGWRTGVVIKNLIPQSYDTYQMGEKTGSIKTSPQLRAGVSYEQELYTLAVDMDITQNRPVAFEGKSRLISLGAEFNAWNWAQLRAGYRINTDNSNRNVWSAGFGLSPFGAHLDVAVTGNANEIGGAFQLGFLLR